MVYKQLEIRTKNCLFKRMRHATNSVGVESVISLQVKVDLHAMKTPP